MSLSCRAANMGCRFTSNTSQGLGVHWKSCKYRDLAMVEALRKRKAHEDAVGLAQKRVRLEEQESQEQPADASVVSALSMPLL